MVTKIAITGASGYVGHAVLDALWDSNAESTAIVRKPCVLRASKVLVGSLDCERVQKAIRSADVVIHLAGACRPKPSETYYGTNVASAAAVAQASLDSNVKRIVMLSVLGADECSSNEYLNTKAKAERVLLGTRIPTVVFRSSHIIGDPEHPGMFAESLLSRDGEPVKIPGNGKQLISPVSLGDAAQAIARAVESKRTGIYELSGPDQLSIDDLARLLNGNEDVPLNHLPSRLAMYLSRVIPGTPSGWIEVVTRPSVGNPTRAARDFGLTFRSLGSLWHDTQRSSTLRTGWQLNTCESSISASA